MKLVVTLERDESGAVVAECPAIPGCVSQGQTLISIDEADYLGVPVEGPFKPDHEGLS